MSSVERIAKPVEQPPRGVAVAQDGRERAMPVLVLQEPTRDDSAIDQILRKNGPPDQALRAGSIELRQNEVPLERAQIGQQLAVDTGAAVDGTRLPPEFARLHGKPAGERIQSVKLLFDSPEAVQQVVSGIPLLARPTESVVDGDPLG